ncbi:MAG TPA: hypothetical protein VM143_13790 [Acidimicrobiales bacterium]|nr:hypothetical protein [Acidimicrobiales bacterium]
MVNTWSGRFHRIQVEGSTRREDAATATLGVWMSAGIAIDGWAHNTHGARLETFLTPWHAVLYSGFAAAASWMLVVVNRRLGPRVRTVDAVPLGYGLGLVGVALFALGGLGDGLWHTLFGVEVNIEALLSPTHLMLFVGALLVLTTPLRTRSARTASGTPRSLLPAIVSLAVATQVVMFFFLYISAVLQTPPSGPAFGRFARLVYRSDVAHELWTVRVLAEILVTNLLWTAPVLLLVRRFRAQPGCCTILGSLVAVPAVLLAGTKAGLLATSFVAGGAAADAMIAIAKRRHWREPATLIAVGCAVPLATWATYYAVVALALGGVAFAADLWVGSIVLAVLAGTFLAALIAPAGIAHAPATEPLSA